MCVEINRFDQRVKDRKNSFKSSCIRVIFSIKITQKYTTRQGLSRLIIYESLLIRTLSICNENLLRRFQGMQYWYHISILLRNCKFFIFIDKSLVYLTLSLTQVPSWTFVQKSCLKHIICRLKLLNFKKKKNELSSERPFSLLAK